MGLLNATLEENNYHVDRTYLTMLKEIRDEGILRKDRTGVGTIGQFGKQAHYNLQKGFPLLTTKKIYTRAVIGELLFFLTGRTDNQWLNDRNIHIWDEWAGEDGDLGPIYGYQWRHFGAPYISQIKRDAGENPGGVDQISNVLQSLKNDPFSRRHIISAWNPEEIDHMALPPCHTMFQFYVTPDDNGNPYGLSCHLYQRSADTFLGVPFNIASYAILTHMFADYLNLVPLEFVHTIGDAHIYTNHLPQVNEQLSRINDVKKMCNLHINHPFDLSTMDFSDASLFNKYSIEDFNFINYESLPTIKAPIAV